MKELPFLIGHKLGYRDSVSGESLTAVKAVNITEECSFPTNEHGHAILLYSNKDPKHGTLVQFLETYNPDDLLGWQVSLALNELSPKLIDGYSFNWGLSGEALHDIAKQCAPET